MVKKQATLELLFNMTPLKPENYPLAIAQTTALAPLQQSVTLELDEPQIGGAQNIEISNNGANMEECLIVNQQFSPQQISTAEDIQAQPLNIPDPQLLKMLNKPIALLKGLYVVVHQPTEQHLFVRFENLNEIKWKELYDYILVYMKEIDTKYAKRNSRGRGFQGTGTLVADKKTMTITYSPFPSSQQNVFKTLRKMRSDAYAEHCPTTLKRQKDEGFQNNINILPYSEVLDFQAKVKDMDLKIDEVNAEIKAFIQTDDFANHITSIGTILTAEEAKFMQTKRWNVDHCSMLATDIALDTATVKQHIEDEYRKMFDHVGEVERKALEDFDNTQMQARRNLAETTLESLRLELNGMVQRVVASSQRQPEKVKADLERLRRKVVSIGLDQLEPTVTQIMEVFDKPEKAMELFGRKDIAGAIDERLDALVASLE